MIETILALSFLLPATLAAGYYAIACLASRLHRPPPAASPRTSFAVLVPAHNEELSLPALLDSLARLDYPRHLFRVHVIADNCTDRTAAIARESGVNVMERNQPHLRGKGYGLEYALKEVLPLQPDAVLIIDADGELAPDALGIFDRGFQAGAAVIQGSIRTRNGGDGAGSLVAAAGNLLDDRMAMGRDVLGLRVPLRGSNMAFRRDVLERIPWTCHGLTEDAEYSAKLAAAGIRVKFAPEAQARSESPARLADLQQQRRRWRAALGTSPLAWLDSKPLVLAQLVLTTMIAGIATMMTLQIWMILWAAALWMTTMMVYATALPALWPVMTQRSLIGIPNVLLKLLGTTLGRRESEWRRTRRAAEG